MRMRLLLFIVMGWLSLAGCAGQGQLVQPTGLPPGPTNAIPTGPTATVAPAATGTATPGAATPGASPAAPQTDLAQKMVDLATERLADKLGTEARWISLVDVQPVAWPDESLGCPLGGQNYAQVITPGYLIELETAGQIYAFHSDRTGRVVLCGLEPTREIFQPP